MQIRSPVHAIAITALALAPLGGGAACNDHPLKAVEYEPESVKTGDVPIAVNRDVDILFVIDNSGSMGEEQANLAANFDAFIGVLEQAGINANYRIGITTTDNGGCGEETSPERGRMRATSCRTRLEEFTWEGVQAEDACLDFCEHADLEVQASAIACDPELVPRPWFERIDGVSNLPAGVSTVDAFACLGPQGIDGCGYESPLESMYMALTRATAATEPSYGFLRDNAILAVVFVTDELDCSANRANAGAFDDDGMRALWSDPERPTSAICWNAGVACTGGSGTYEECHSVERGEDGQPSVDEDAVLYPVSRYTEFLQGIEDTKRSNNPDQVVASEVLVAAIAGVPADYPATDVVYADAPPQGSPNNANFQVDYGIGPGCTSEFAEAVPPVRLREFAEAFAVNGRPNLFSVCEADYSPALRAIADAIGDQIKPSCMVGCAEDFDPLTIQVEPSCVLTERRNLACGEAESVTVNLPACLDASGRLPAAADACYVAKGDPGGATPQVDDDVHEDCIASGYNLEFEVFRRGGGAAPAGTSVRATCELSQSPERECPGGGGGAPD